MEQGISSYQPVNGDFCIKKDHLYAQISGLLLIRSADTDDTYDYICARRYCIDY